MVTLTPGPTGMKIEEDVPPEPIQKVDTNPPRVSKHSRQGRRKEKLKAARLGRRKRATVARKRNR